MQAQEKKPQWQLPLEKKYVLAPLIVLLSAVILFALEPHSSELLKYNRTLVLDGQWWRFLTANIVHTNFNHLMLNGLGLIAIWYIQAEHFTTSRYFAILSICAIGTAVGIHLFGNLDNYAGLSGALHGVIIYGAVADIKQRVQFGIPLFVGIVVKVAAEQYFGPDASLEQFINAKVAIDAHLYGLVVGLVLALPMFRQMLRHGRDPLPEEKPESKTASAPQDNDNQQKP